MTDGYLNYYREHNDLNSDNDDEFEYEDIDELNTSFYGPSITSLMRYGIEDISSIASILFLENMEENELNLVLNESFNVTIQQNIKNPEKILNIDSKKFNKNISCYNECSVCITNFETNDDIIEIKCKHIFHNECIKEWYKYKNVCPLCRAEI